MSRHLEHVDLKSTSAHILSSILISKLMRRSAKHLQHFIIFFKILDQTPTYSLVEHLLVPKLYYWQRYKTKFIIIMSQSTFESKSKALRIQKVAKALPAQSSVSVLSCAVNETQTHM
jgi:hypothetical protein